MSIGIEKVPMGIFFDLKSVRKQGGEWSCREKAIVIVEEGLVVSFVQYKGMDNIYLIDVKTNFTYENKYNII